MSIKIMTMVWEHFDASGTKLLAMLAMADWCNDAGGSLHPSMAAVAAKVRVSEKQARRIVHELEDEGWLACVGHAHGGAPGTTKQWHLNVQRLAALAKSKECQTPPAGVTPPMDVTPPTGVPDASHPAPRRLPPVSETPPTGGSQTTIEPSIEPPRNRQVVRARTALAPAVGVQRPDGVSPEVWAAWLQLRKSKRAPVSMLVVSAAANEAEKAGMTLEGFLSEWVYRGSQGLKAEWLATDRQAAPARRSEQLAVQAPRRDPVARNRAVNHDGLFDDLGGHA